MNGWFVVNASLPSDTFIETEQALKAAAEKHDIWLEQKTNETLLAFWGGAPRTSFFKRENIPDFVIFWDKDVRLAAYLEQYGVRVYNSARAIELCDDKSLMYQCLAEHSIAIPKTVIAPQVYAAGKSSEWMWLESVIEELGFPLVVKECFGSWGEQVYLIDDEFALRDCLTSIDERPLLFQELVVDSFGCDTRIHVVGSHCVSAIRRTSPSNTFLTGRTAGSCVEPYQISCEEEEIALRCIAATGLDFGCVDLFCGDIHKPVVCEVNSNAQFYGAAHNENSVDVATHIIRHISDDMKDGLGVIGIKERLHVYS
ncbi:MAG: RimK family alpha-L-glutamate ligase [Coriobacteriia bacterium]|nr:RimK family alpha-L-glutamate ligase [Coriobacteriia bacterium]